MFMRNLIGALAAAAAISLGGCGGGGDEGNDFGTYVEWENNANGHVIVDWNNDRYAVRRSDRVVVSLQDNSGLPNLTVTTTGDLMDRGTKAGGVFSGTSTSGQTIAVFKCTNGRSLNITETTTTYSYACV